MIKQRDWLSKIGILLLLGLMTILAAGCQAPPAGPPTVLTPTPSPKGEITPSAKPKLQRVKLQNPSFGSTFANFYMGKELGIFKEEGIDLEPMVIKSVLTMPVLMAGEVDFTTVFSFALYGAMRGQPVKALMSFKSGGSWYLFGARGIQTPQDLKGKTVAVTSVGSLGHTATKEALRYLGLDPDKEVTFIGVGGESERWLALKGGSVAGAALSPPYNIIAKEDGFKEFVFTGDVVELASNGLAASVKLLQENPDLVRRMIRSTIKSNIYMKDHPQESIQFLRKEFNMDEVAARATHEVWIKTTIINGLPTEKALQNLVQMGKETGQLTGKEKLEDGLDFSLLKDVLKELKLQ